MTPQDPSSLNYTEILTLLPHRYPFLLVDRVEDITLGQRAVGIKNVTGNEWFFPGHFPDNPIMPGVLIVEAMAQTAGLLVTKTLKMQEVYQNVATFNVAFMSISDARFRHPVKPGDTLHMHVTKQRNRGDVWRFEGKSYVKTQCVAEACFTAMIQK